MQSGGESFVCTQMFNLADSDGSGTIDVLELSMFFRDVARHMISSIVLIRATSLHR